MKNQEIYFTYFKDLFKQGFKFDRYKNLHVVLRVIMFILLLPVFLLGMLSSLYYVIFYGIFRVLKAPADYIMSFIRNEGEQVKSPAQLIIYLIGFPIALAFELASLVIWIFLCLIFIDVSIMFSIFTLGSTNFYPFLFNQKERVAVKPYRSPILNFIVNTIIIALFVTLAVFRVFQLNEQDVEISVLVNSFYMVSLIGYIIVPFEKKDLLLKKNTNDNPTASEEKKEEPIEASENSMTLASNEDSTDTVNSQKECPKRNNTKLVRILLSTLSIILVVVASVAIIFVSIPKKYETPKDAVYEHDGSFEYKIKGDRIYDLTCLFDTIAEVNLNNYFKYNEVISIGENGFADCKYLEKIILPDSLKRIKKGAFAQCSSLATIEFPKSLEVIEDEVFSGTNLYNVYIGKEVKVMGKNVFSHVQGLFIDCEAKKKPIGWDKDWDIYENYNRHYVTFGIKRQ